MLFSLNPGYIYIFSKKSNFEVTEIGKAANTDCKEFLLKLVNPNLQLQSCKFFLDVDAALSHLKSVFAPATIASASYEAHYKDVVDLVDEYSLTCKPMKKSFEEVCQGLTDQGQLKLESSEAIFEDKNSALSTILCFVPLTADGRNIQELIAAVFLDATDASAVAQLTACGLIPHLDESLVLLDKSESSALKYIFQDTACEETWQLQLSEYAGLTPASRAVTLEIWLDYTHAGQEIVDKVSPLVFDLS